MAKSQSSVSIKACSECKKPMRPNNQLARDFPNTVPHGGHGMCTNCNRKQRLANRPGTVFSVSGKASVEENRRSTEAFLKKISADRRRLEQRQKIRMVIR